MSGISDLQQPLKKSRGHRQNAAATGPNERREGSGDYWVADAGQLYPVVQVDHLFWMARNFAYAGAGRVFEGNYYGLGPHRARLYSGDEARKNVPDGWRLPTYEEWMALAAAIGTPLVDETGRITLQAEGCYISDAAPFAMAGEGGFYWTAERYCLIFLGFPGPGNPPPGLRIEYIATENGRVTEPAMPGVFEGEAAHFSVRYVRDVNE